MNKRIFGIETEFGCFVRDSSVGPTEKVVQAVKDFAFHKQRLGAIDLHARNYAFEPARSGGFLINGGRLYVDAVGDHEEYATPECASVFDLVAYDKAGHRILQTILDDMGIADRVSFHNNNIDHFGGHTFGCHENYLVSLTVDFFREAVAYLLPFLVTRQIFAGAGRVGGHRLNRHDLRGNVMSLGEHEADYLWIHDFYGVELDRTVRYQLSQRADHIVKAVSGKVRFNRAIINPRWDSYYASDGQHRLHLLFGESNMSEYAAALKVGTTCIVLDLVEAGRVPESVRISDPVRTLKEISRDQRLRWLVRRSDGGTITAVDLQRIYLDAAKRYYSSPDPETEWVLREWENVLDALEVDPMSLADRLDWVAKRRLVETYMEAEGVGWDADVLHSIDLEYHNVNPSQSLFYALQEAGDMRRVVSNEDIERATTTPPPGTRACGRALIVREILASGNRRYVIDWDSVYVDRGACIELKDPFNTYVREAVRFARRL
ncbi:MAG: proteasome accessory factor PafA2 family protein [Armatimonadota bacterium]